MGAGVLGVIAFVIRLLYTTPEEIAEVEGVAVGRADAVLAASIFHFGEHTVGEAKRHMAEHGIEVRL